MRYLFVLIALLLSAQTVTARTWWNPGGSSTIDGVSTTISIGTLTDTYLCRYDLASTEIDCNLNPVTYQTANSNLSLSW